MWMGGRIVNEIPNYEQIREWADEDIRGQINGVR